MLQRQRLDELAGRAGGPVKSRTVLRSPDSNQNFMGLESGQDVMISTFQYYKRNICLNILMF